MGILILALFFLIGLWVGNPNHQFFVSSRKWIEDMKTLFSKNFNNFKNFKN
jgi:hypothetical protein